MTEKQKKFCNEYLLDANASRAYMVAYPDVKKAETARAAASRMLANVNISNYIKKRQEETARAKNITRERIIERLANVAFGDTLDIVTVKGNKRKTIVLSNFEELTPHQRSMIAGVEPVKLGKGSGIRVKLHDSLKATEMLIKLLGFDKTEEEQSDIITGVVMLPAVIEEEPDPEDEPHG